MDQWWSVQNRVLCRQQSTLAVWHMWLHASDHGRCYSVSSLVLLGVPSSCEKGKCLMIGEGMMERAFSSTCVTLFFIDNLHNGAPRDLANFTECVSSFTEPLFCAAVMARRKVFSTQLDIWLTADWKHDFSLFHSTCSTSVQYYIFTVSISVQTILVSFINLDMHSLRFCPLLRCF